jgi:Ca2+-transporting ATPase
MLEAIACMGAFFFVFWANGVSFAALQDATPALLHGAGPLLGVYREATTAALVAIVACQVGNAFVCRAHRGRLDLSPRPAFWGALATEAAILVALVGVPPLARAFQTAPLPGGWAPGFAALPLLFIGLNLLARRLLRVAQP